jgi:hypothetical protein
VPYVFRPATLVLFNIPVHLRRNFSVGETERVTFTQITAEPQTHRDAVRFMNGTTVLLQCLEPGQKVEVVSLEEIVQPDFREVAILR